MKNLQRTSKIKPFINKYNWKGINYPSGKDDWKKFENNYSKIALNVLYVIKMNIYPTYISKHHLNHEKQIILLMIPNRERWDYLALLRGLLIICIIKRNNFKK